MTPSAHVPFAPGHPAFRRALVALFAIGLATFSLLYLVQPILFIVGPEFGHSATQASLLVSVSTAALALAVIPLARLSERWGRRRTMVAGLAVAALAGAGLALAPTWSALLVLRTVQGVALAAVPAAAMAWVAEEVASTAVTRVGGLYIAGTTVGGMAGRLVAGVAADLWGWRWAMVVVAVLAAVAAAAGALLLPRGRGPRTARPRTADRAVADPSRGARVRLYLVGGLGMAMFVGVYNVIGFRTSAPPYLLGAGLGSMFFLTYAAGTVSSALAGRLTARVGMRGAVLVGLGLAAVGVVITLAAPLVVIWLGLLVLAAGFFVAHAVASANVARLAPRPSAASARYTLAYYAGSSIGGVLLGQAWEVGAWGGTAAAALAFLAVTALVAAGLPRRAPR